MKGFVFALLAGAGVVLAVERDPYHGEGAFWLPGDIKRECVKDIPAYEYKGEGAFWLPGEKEREDTDFEVKGKRYSGEGAFWLPL
ncbi:hypothetical protein BCF55_1058 [Hydrogenivirga caldilitoris]|uniref:Uncharacterized protein n=1 Tax=Hydrogenivirga caldilitoris TaxID=246264 RepID=A0A497XPA5_9AQUI|nr:hypothetical protein [Hydrogenivirga caldilitoris]RLJ70775.1 hypothetical protein BCF55_1058 [Hydrogenivirga caldilitoris]